MVEDEEIQDIINSEKSKYLKVISIVYLILGIITLLGSIIYAVSQEDFWIFATGLIAFLVMLFFSIVNMVLYEMHTMNKYLVSNFLSKNMRRQKKMQESITEQEQNNEEELERLLEKLK